MNPSLMTFNDVPLNVQEAIIESMKIWKFRTVKNDDKYRNWKVILGDGHIMFRLKENV